MQFWCWMVQNICNFWFLFCDLLRWIAWTRFRIPIPVFVSCKPRRSSWITWKYKFVRHPLPTLRSYWIWNYFILIQTQKVRFGYFSIKMSRILLILVPFCIPFQELQNGIEIVKIQEVLIPRIQYFWFQIKSNLKNYWILNTSKMDNWCCTGFIHLQNVGCLSCSNNSYVKDFWMKSYPDISRRV